MNMNFSPLGDDIPCNSTASRENRSAIVQEGNLRGNESFVVDLYVGELLKPQPPMCSTEPQTSWLSFNVQAKHNQMGCNSIGG